MNRKLLKDICKNISSGLTPLRSNERYWNSQDIPWVKTEQLGVKHIYDSNEKISQYALEDTSIKINPVNTISIAMYGEGKTRGRVSILKKEMASNQACCNIVINDKEANYEYVYYFLKSQYKQIRALSSGVRKNLNSDNIKNLEIFLPSKRSYQNDVAEILSEIDRKIEINKKINSELEATAKLIYDYWFVQFDFPDENGKPYKSSGGKMVYNEKLNREVPDDWVACAISEWFTSEKSGDWGKESAQDNYTLEVACIRGADIGGLNGEGEEKAPIRYIHKNNKDKILSNFDMVIEISGGSPTQSTGRIAAITPELINRFRHPLICSNFCKVISMKDSNYFYNFFYQWKSFYKSGLFFKWEGKTSGIKNLLFENFIDIYKTTKPPKEIARNFNKLILPLEVKRQTLLDEITELKSLRDWLLPMLMNGQVTVSEERMKSLSKSNK